MQTIQRFFTIVTLSALSAITALAAKPTTPATPELSNQWYTVKNKDGVGLSYYNEKIESKDSKLYVSVNLWNKDQGFLNQEHVFSIIEPGAPNEMHFYSAEILHRETKKKLEANALGKRQFKVTFTPTAGQSKTQTQFLDKNSFPEIAFSYWIGLKLKEAGGLKPNKTVSFRSIRENLETGSLDVESGTMKLLKDDDFCLQTSTKKLEIVYKNEVSTWYVMNKSDSSDSPIGTTRRIVFNKSGLSIEQTTEAAARASL